MKWLDLRISVGDIISLLLTIVIFILGVNISHKIDTLSKIENFNFQIKVNPPLVNNALPSYLYPVSGKITSNLDSNKNAQTEIQKQNLILVEMIQPYSVNKLYVGREVNINTDGSFDDVVQLGDNQNGAEVTYQVAYVLVEKGYFTSGDMLVNLPPGVGKSPSLTLTRINQ